MSASANGSSVCVGICYGHITPIPMTGVPITSSSDKLIENFGAARETDIVLGLCGHVGVIISSQSATKVNNLAQATVGDIFVGIFTGTIMTGAATHNTAG